MSDVAGSAAAIRRTLDGSSDPRVARTRSAIVTAVAELSGSGKDVTVAAIVRAAGVSRAAFYSHFSGLDELALVLTRESFAAIAALWMQESGDGAEAMRRSQQRLVDHYGRNRGLYAAIAALPASKDVHLAGVRSMAAVIENAIRDHPGRPAELDPTATARYIAGAAHGLIDAWLIGDVELRDDQLVDHLVRMLPTWFSGLR